MHLFKKLKYMDKLHYRFFAIMIFLAGFCLFTGVTYSFFALSKYLNSATLSIAKLKYELSSDDERFKDSSIIVSAGEKLELNLDIKSLNNAITKYILNYQTDSDLVKVFYKDEMEQNVSGTIGSLNSVLNAKIIVINESTDNVNVSFFVEGGYLQNELISNINTKYVEESTKTLEVLNLSYSDEKPIFSQISPPLTGIDDTGIYKSQDDYGTTYYYRGNVTNNYVKFGDFYWRIIRINGDGSLRLIYDGKTAHSNNDNSSDRLGIIQTAWNNTNAGDAKYVGFMYGGANGVASTSKKQAQTNEVSSNAKEQLDKWYVANILNKGLNDYVSDTLFCNDRSTNEVEKIWWTNDTTLGYGINMTAYGAFGRFKTAENEWNLVNPSPILTCPNRNDAFTVDDTVKGNGNLTYPIGTITADEVSLAGGLGKTQNTNYYLYKGTFYWTMSPRSLNDSQLAHMLIVGNTGTINQFTLNDAGAALNPVINLKAEYARNLLGTGELNNPYHL